MGLLKETAHSYYSGNDLGNYQFTSLSHVINNFMIGYVGDGKIIPKIKRTDVLFFAQRALQEFSYDTLKSIKSQEITIPPSLTMSLPQDYVNYVKLVWTGEDGIERVLYPNSKTSNPNKVAQDSDGNYIFQDDKTLVQFPLSLTVEQVTTGQTSFEYNLHELNFDSTTLSSGVAQESNPDTNPIEGGMEISSPYFPIGTTVTAVTDPTSVATGFVFTTSNPANTNTPTANNVTIVFSPNSTTWESYKNSATLENQRQNDYDNSYTDLEGERYGIDPQFSQINGSFYIDEISGKIHFSSNISGKTVILKYISDGLGTDEEMVVHKFAEEAMYKHIAYAILSTRSNVQEYLVNRFKKEKFAETRKAKLRLSSIKIEELTQILRGKSKQIKH